VEAPGTTAEAVAAVETVPLEHGAALHCAMHARDGSVEVGLGHEGNHLGGAIFHHGAPKRRLRVSTRALEADLGIELDHFRGEISAHGHLEVAGHPLVSFDHVIASYSPCSGVVGDSTVPDPPVVRSGRFGASQASASHVTRIYVDEEERLFTPVGGLVKRYMFPQHPSFVFNTVACVGAHDPATDGASYTDPHSVWFNVFLGYYQIDAPKRDWDRPFGYRAPAERRSDVELEDLVRLGKSDWNWFSNWMYGVPEQQVLAYSDVDMTKVKASVSDPQMIGSSLWHTVEVDDVEFVSAYESAAPGAARLVRNSLLTGLWQRAYGPRCPRPEWRSSFVPTRMNARLLMSYFEDDESFHTVIFGGTSLADTDRAFLEAQLAAGRAVIERSYPELGFRPGRFNAKPAPQQASPADARG
jgi:hypothetical protein